MEQPEVLEPACAPTTAGPVGVGDPAAPAMELDPDNIDMDQAPYVVLPPQHNPPSSPVETRKPLLMGSNNRKAEHSMRFLIRFCGLALLGLVGCGILFIYLQSSALSSSFTFESAIPQNKFPQNDFVEFLAKAISAPTQSLKVTKVEATTVGTTITINLLGSEIGFKGAEAAWKVIGEYGGFSVFKVTAFSRGVAAPAEICGDQRYGFECQLCMGCGPMDCDAGALGSGKCMCRNGYTGNLPLAKGNMTIGTCLSTSATPLEIGPVVVGSTTASSVLITNVGANPVTVSYIDRGDLADGIFDVELHAPATFPITLVPGQTFSLKVFFKPTLAKIYTRELQLRNSAGKISVSVDLIGKACGASEETCFMNFTQPKVLARINCGSYFSYVDEYLKLWEIDSWYYGGLAGDDKSVTNPVKRFWRAFNISESSGYDIAVEPKGQYKVVLYFYSLRNATKDYSFDVTVEGNRTSVLLSRKNATVVVEQQVNGVSDGKLSILFSGNAYVHAIEIFQLTRDLSDVLTLDKKASGSYDYGQALGRSLIYFHIQKSGRIKTVDKRLAWREDSCAYCYDGAADYSGGYYNSGGDFIKSTFVNAFTVTQLAWTAILFKDGLIASGQYDEILVSIRHGTDYLMSCGSNGAEKFVGQVGYSGEQFLYFGPPEKFSPSSIWLGYITPENPASEVLGEASAALAAASIVLKDSDSAYASNLLKFSKSLLDTAIKYPGSYNSSTDPIMKDHQKLYPSQSYTDELAWAALWLYRATQSDSYMKLAKYWYKDSSSYGGWSYGYENKAPALHILFASLDSNSTEYTKYSFLAKDYFKEWMPGPGSKVQYTPMGLAFRNAWGSVPRAVASSFLALAFSKVLENRGADPCLRLSLQRWATSQVNYALGDSGRSLMVGFGSQYPVRPMHKPSFFSILAERYYGIVYEQEDFYSDEIPNVHIAYGALHGGTSWPSSDGIADSHSDYVPSKPSLEWTAVMTGALSGLSEKYAVSVMSDCNLDLGWTFAEGIARPSNRYSTGC